VVDFACLQVGDTLPPLVMPPISRHALALYCGASGDHNPIHVDLDFARAAGMPDVFAHGMLSMAYIARMLTHWTAQENLRSLGVRFVAITQVGESITCTGKVVDSVQQDGETRLRVVVTAINQNGETRLTGEAVVATPH